MVKKNMPPVRWMIHVQVLKERNVWLEARQCCWSHVQHFQGCVVIKHLR